MTVRLTARRVFVLLILFLAAQLALYKLYGAIHWHRAASAPFPRATIRPTDTSGLPVLRIGFIGDSNSVRGNPSAPARCAQVLSVSGKLRVVEIVNAGRGGTSIADWRPDAPTGHFRRAVEAFDSAGVGVVSVMLGTNPGGNPEADLRAICAALKTSGRRVILHEPPYSRFDDVRTAEARRVIDKLCEEGLAEPGDRLAAEYFRRFPSLIAEDGIHYTQEGYDRLGEMWAHAIAATLRPCDTSVQSGQRWLRSFVGSFRPSARAAMFAVLKRIGDAIAPTAQTKRLWRNGRIDSGSYCFTRSAHRFAA